MKKLIWLSLPVLFLAGCGKPEVNYVLKVKLHKLTEESLYQKELVYDVIFDAEEQNLDSLKKQSRQEFLEGIDLFKNKKQPAKAVQKFTASILLFPEAKTYYELGNALMQLPSREADAIKAYNVAEYLQFEPVSNIYHNLACAYGALSLRNKAKAEYKDQVTDYLQKAVEAGLPESAITQSDNRLAPALQSQKFRDFITYHKARQLSNNTDALFALFRSSFPVAHETFEIPVEKVNMREFSRSVSYDFARFIPEMQNTSFGREVSHEYFYVAKVAETPLYTALVYSSVGFYDEEMQPVQTKLVTYGNDGKIINSMLLSCQCSAEKVKKGTISNGQITLEDYKRTWKHPIDKVDFEENEVLNHELLATATFRIDDTGKFVEQSVPENYTDKSILALQLPK